MDHTLKSEVERFMSDAGIGEHRTGIVLAKNGRLVDRLRRGRPIWTHTEDKIRAAIVAEREKRGLPEMAAAT